MFDIHSEDSFLLLQQCAENSPCLLLWLQCNGEGALWPNFLWSTCLGQSTLIVHFACMTLLPWGSSLLFKIYFNFPFYLLLFLLLFFFFFCLHFSEACREWVFSFLATCCFLPPYSISVYVSHFCIFFWQCLPFRAALNFASSVMTIFPEQENTILLPSQAVLVDGGYFLS